MDTLLAALKGMVLIYLCIFLKDPVSKYFNQASDAVSTPIINTQNDLQTSTQMRSYLPLLIDYFDENKRLPENLGEWLRSEFSLNQRDAALDGWGRPFEWVMLDDTKPALRSLGPDGQRETQDDLVMKIMTQ
ncbi:MAG: hypothetical protein SGI71_02380 [Verrucomicrobiota bacterium]|nr:hypothetical protein [Verrucomicrobiota bacterium]